MGTRVGRIVKDFVIRQLVEAGTPVEISFHRHRALGKIVDATDESLDVEILEGSAATLGRGEQLQVFLRFRGNHHAFDSTCLAPAAESVGKTVLRISQPTGLTRDLERKYERIRVPEGMEVFFVIQGRRFDLGFPKAKRGAPVSTAAAAAPAQAQTRSAKLNELVKGFRLEVAESFSTNSIVMFRERQPSGYSERVVSEIGAVLWIPMLEDGVPETEALPDVPIITASELKAHELATGTPENLVEAKIARVLISKRSEGIFAEATVPILYSQYVLGVVRVVNSQPRREAISPESVLQVWQFAEVLSSVLERSGYVASGSTDRRRYDAPVVDMSASGLLFHHPSPELATELLVNTDIKINLVVEGRTIVVTGRVRRKYTEPGEVYYGVQYAEISPEDFQYLFQYLYGRSPRDEDASLWEGGAPPPRVDIFGDQS